MPEAFQVTRQPLSSLATKIISFVCLSTSATALLVSGIAIQTTTDHLSAQLDVRLPATLERTAAEIELWRAGEPGGAALDESARQTLAELLEQERAGIGRLLLLDAEDEVIAAAHDPSIEAENRVSPNALSQLHRVHDYPGASGARVVGSAHPLADGWHLVIEEPFQRAYSPVVAVVTRVFAVDVAVILLFSFLAYRITTAVVRPIETLSEAARRIAQGQFDHEVPEPERSDEVGLLARTFNDMMRRLRGYQTQIETTNERLRERNAELQQAKETFEQLSITDGLTHLHNHRFFQDHLTREIKRVTRTGEALTMLLIDIDDFKGLNDRYGHAAGDELLSGLARIMNEKIRDSDLLARYGGEEFVVLASNTEIVGAYSVAEKIRTSIAETSFILDDSLRPTRVTVSIGVARYRGNRKTFFQATDRALYRAKAEGKNCVVVDEDEELA